MAARYWRVRRAIYHWSRTSATHGATLALRECPRLTLQLIQSAQQAGFTLQELKALMPAPGEHKREALIQALESKVRHIEAMQAQLAHSKAQLLGVIHAVRLQPEGVPCSMGQKQVLASIKLDP